MEKLVSPSQWSDRPNVIEKHVQLVAQESNRVRESIQDVETRYYGKRSSTKMEIFGMKTNEDSAPMFVYISGGYWQELSGDISLYPVQPLYEKGVVTVILDYSRAPKVTMPEIVEEVIEGAKVILDIAVQRGSRSIILSGHSAGSQLCSMILISDWFLSLRDELRSLFKGVFHLSGVFNLETLLNTYVNDVLKMDLSMAKRLSPLDSENLKKLEQVALPHNYIIVGEKDSPLFKEQSQEFAAQMIKMPLVHEVQYIVIPTMDHFNLVENLMSRNYEVTKNILYFINKLIE